MKIGIRHIIGTLLLFIALIGINVYQFQNPRVIQVPEYIQTPIDSTAWVQRSAYLHRGALLDSLRAENSQLAERIRSSRDQLANVTRINARLRIQADSIQEETGRFEWDPTAFLNSVATQPADTTFFTRRTFGGGLFQVGSWVHITPDHVHNDIAFSQLRPLQITVTTTMDPDQHRILSYVSSPDIQDLEITSYSELQPKNKLPWFWIGMGVGAVSTILITK